LRFNLDKKLLNAVGAFDNETVAAIKNYSGSVAIHRGGLPRNNWSVTTKNAKHSH
jgi:hypothetical protein